MKKLKSVVFFSLFIILLISIGSISAVDINKNHLQSYANFNEENSLDKDVSDISDISDIYENNSLDDETDFNGLISSDIDSGNVISASDEDIAKDIKVNFSNVAYQNNMGNISVELPDEASGYLSAAIDDVIIYNESIRDRKIQIPITIPEPKPPYFVVNKKADSLIHNVSIFYNGLLINLTNSTLKEMFYPSEHGFFLNVPEEILKGDKNSYQTVALIFPSSANANVKIYLDGNLFQTSKASQYVFLNISKINSLGLGSHTIKAIYSGDDYYLPCERNSTFKVVDFLIQIPKSIVLDHDDCIYAKSVKYTDGTISVYFDGKRIISKKLDSYHEFLESLFDKVSCGNHLIEVKYASSKFNYSKKENVNVSYIVDIWGDSFRYGDDNSITISVPHDFSKKLIHIMIDKKPFSSFEIDDDGWIDLNISKLAGGKHTLEFKFDGDKKYYSYSEDHNFTVYYGFVIPDFIEYLDGSAVSLDLPSSAKGNLELYINNKLYKSVKLANGKASIKIDNFPCDEYEISLNYTGNDFDVEIMSSNFSVMPKAVSPISIKYGEDKYIVIQTSKDTKGYIVFHIGKDKHKVAIKDGKAKLSLKKFKIGEYYIDYDYIGENGYNCSYYTYVEVLAHKIKITGAKNLSIKYGSNKYYKVKVYNKFNKLAKGVILRFKVGKKTFKVKTNSKGIAKLKLSKFAPKKYKVTITYKGTKVTRKLTVKHILKLKKAKVKRSAKKLVLKASLSKVNGKYLKGKLIKFKFKGKTYKSKTNSKGLAKITVKRNVLKKLKAGKKITYKASYLKDNVKRTVKVKR